MKISSVFFFLIVFAFSHQMQAQDYSKQYQKTADNFEKLLIKGDAQGIADLFTTDGQMNDLDGTNLNGPTAIKNNYSGQFSGIKYKDVDITVDEVMTLPGDYVMGRGSYTATMMMDGQTMKMKGFYQNLCKVIDGKLKIHRHLGLVPAPR